MQVGNAVRLLRAWLGYVEGDVVRGPIGNPDAATREALRMAVDFLASNAEVLDDEVVT